MKRRKRRQDEEWGCRRWAAGEERTWENVVFSQTERAVETERRRNGAEKDERVLLPGWIIQPQNKGISRIMLYLLYPLWSWSHSSMYRHICKYCTNHTAYIQVMWMGFQVPRGAILWILMDYFPMFSFDSALVNIPNKSENVFLSLLNICLLHRV